MSTEAQIAANQANSEKSTGPKTEAGKAASSQNGYKHGLAMGGMFRVLKTESPAAFVRLILGLTEEFKPATQTEVILVERMAEHHWLRERAILFQNNCMEDVMEKGQEPNIPVMNLYLRYQTTHERAYHKCLNDLLKLRSERQKEQIGFAQQAQKAELHRIAVRSREGEADYQQIRKSNAQNDAWRQKQRFERETEREHRAMEAQQAA